MNTPLIGPAARAAALIDKIVADARLGGKPIKLLLHGPPGTGKSTLARHTCQQLGADLKWAVTKMSGSALKVDGVADIERVFATTSLFGDWRVLIIEEADCIPSVAQVRFLNSLDDMGKCTAVICTSNSSLKNFEARFQSRFQSLEIKGPNTAEIELLLVNQGVHPASARQIATFSCGNVRQALLDASTALQAAA